MSSSVMPVSFLSHCMFAKVGLKKCMSVSFLVGNTYGAVTFCIDENKQFVVLSVLCIISDTHIFPSKGTSGNDTSVQINIPTTGSLHISKSSVVGIMTVLLVTNTILGASFRIIVSFKYLVGNGWILNIVAGCLCSMGMIIERPK